MPDAQLEALERAAARHWQAPETEPLGEWQLRAAAGFTGRANSALPLGDAGCPLPEAVTTVEEWYRRRDLRPMIVLPQGAAPDHLETHLTKRGWLPRPAPAFVMIANVDTLPASQADVSFAPEPDPAFPLASGRPGAVSPSCPTNLIHPASLTQLTLHTGAAGRGGSCFRSRRATTRPARSTSGAASRTRTGTTT